MSESPLVVSFIFIRPIFLVSFFFFNISFVQKKNGLFRSMNFCISLTIKFLGILNLFDSTIIEENCKFSLKQIY